LEKKNGKRRGLGFVDKLKGGSERHEMGEKWFEIE